MAEILPLLTYTANQLSEAGIPWSVGATSNGVGRVVVASGADNVYDPSTPWVPAHRLTIDLQPKEDWEPYQPVSIETELIVDGCCRNNLPVHSDWAASALTKAIDQWVQDVRQIELASDKRITTVTNTKTCCVCTKTIDEKIVELGMYGLSFHPDCFVGTTGPQMVRLMGEDCTVVRTAPGASPCLRVRNATNVRANGTVAGDHEIVNW